MSSMTDWRRMQGFGAGRCRERGFSLVELMIASTIGLLILTAMISVFVSSVQSRNEVDKSSRQIENGRFAVEMLREDIQLAAFYGDYFPTSYTAVDPATNLLDPCQTILSNMGFITPGVVPVGIYGIPNADTTATPTCLSDRKAATDILVVRRTSTTQLKIDANPENGTRDDNVMNEDGSTGVTVASLGYGHYLQVSNCSDTPAEDAYVLAKEPAKFILHGVKPAGTPATCTDATAGLAPVRQYLVRIFYIATCNDCSGAGDGIPTLKMVELTPAASACTTVATESCGSMTPPRSIAEGIENLQFEYGVDTKSDGTVPIPGTPYRYLTAPAAADWEHVMAVKIFLLARNTETSAGYTDNKVYCLASDPTASVPYNCDTTDPTFGDTYKRHVYVATARANNIANRKGP